MRILVVDDCPDTADSTAFLLRADGHDAQVARSEEEALQAVLRAGPWDGLIVDQWLQPGPIDGGTRLLERLRAGGFGQPAAILTAVGAEAYAEACRRVEELGRAVCVRKPADPLRVARVLAGMRGEP